MSPFILLVLRLHTALKCLFFPQAPPLPASPPPMSPPKSPTEGDLLDDDTPEAEEQDGLVSPTNDAIEVFDLPDESSSEAVTPDMDSQVRWHTPTGHRAYNSTVWGERERR